VDSNDLKVLISEGEDGWLVVECPSIPGCISQERPLKRPWPDGRK